MKCQRSEELWSEHLEGRLPPPLLRDLEEHLAGCPDCGTLLDTFREIILVLESLPRPQPASDLLERILTDSQPTLARLRERANWWAAASWGNWAAWGTAAALVAVLLLGPEETISRMRQLGHQAYAFGLGLYHDTEALIDGLNVIRITVGVAFEDRLDRLNQRLQDLEEARRKSEATSNQSSRLNGTQSSVGLTTETTLSPTRRTA